MSEADYYRLVRSQIEHENQLVGNRLNWLLTSQSFLVMAYAITVNGPARDPLESWYAAQAVHLLVLIPLLALGICAITYGSILGAIFAQQRLRQMARARLSNEYQQIMPPVHGYSPFRRLGHGTPILLPLLFLIVWAILLLGGAGFPPPKHVAPVPRQPQQVPISPVPQDRTGAS